MSYKFNRGCWVNSALSIKQKIALAHQIFADQEQELTRDHRINGLISQLQDDLRLSWKCMIDYGIGSRCAHCDSTAPQGSCCSQGLEDKYDTSLLIANLLLGLNLPRTHVRQESCFFLGYRGCTLRVRNMLCVDYLCPELEKELGPGSVAEIQNITAGEAKTTFLLCDAIKKIINSSNGLVQLGENVSPVRIPPLS